MHCVFCHTYASFPAEIGHEEKDRSSVDVEQCWAGTLTLGCPLSAVG